MSVPLVAVAVRVLQRTLPVAAGGPALGLLVPLPLERVGVVVVVVIPRWGAFEEDCTIRRLDFS